VNTLFQARQFNLSGLNGISDETLEMHFKLYDGYVKSTNALTEAISEFFADGKVDQHEMPEYSELTRRLGIEYNGMILHEYYFGNMLRAGVGEPDKNSFFFEAAERRSIHSLVSLLANTLVFQDRFDRREQFNTAHRIKHAVNKGRGCACDPVNNAVVAVLHYLICISAARHLTIESVEIKPYLQSIPAQVSVT
jgi:hypothetical protein